MIRFKKIDVGIGEQRYITSVDFTKDGKRFSKAVIIKEWGEGWKLFASAEEDKFLTLLDYDYKSKKELRLKLERYVKNNA